LLFTFTRYFVNEELYWIIESNQTKIPKFILKKVGLNNE